MTSATNGLVRLRNIPAYVYYIDTRQVRQGLATSPEGATMNAYTYTITDENAGTTFTFTPGTELTDLTKWWTGGEINLAGEFAEAGEALEKLYDALRANASVTELDGLASFLGLNIEWN